MDAQAATLKAFVGGRANWVVVADYEERASGKDVAGRPEFRRLMTDAASGRFDMVATARIDRWSRSSADLMSTLDQLAAVGVGFASASDPVDTSTPTGRLALQVQGVFAEFERNSIIDRITRGNAAKVARGIPLTRRVGYGMTTDEHGVVIADPDTIGVVRRIFTDYADRNQGARTVAAHLNDEHLPGPGTRPWSAQSILHVLGNRTYVGQLWHVGAWHPGRHKPLIDPDLFARAQHRREEMSRPATAARERGVNVLSGVVRCGRCGASYVGTTGTSRSGAKVRYYTCGAARRYGATTCRGPSLPAVELEMLVAEHLLDAYADSALFDQAIAEHEAAHACAVEPVTEQAVVVRAALSKARRLRAKYQADYEAERLSAARYETRAAELDADITSLGAQLADLEARLAAPESPVVPNPEQLERMRDHLREAVRSGDAGVRKRVFTSLVETVTVHDYDNLDITIRLYGYTADS